MHGGWAGKRTEQRIHFWLWSSYSWRYNHHRYRNCSHKNTHLLKTYSYWFIPFDMKCSSQYKFSLHLVWIEMTNFRTYLENLYYLSDCSPDRSWLSATESGFKPESRTALALRCISLRPECADMFTWPIIRQLSCVRLQLFSLTKAQKQWKKCSCPSSLVC